MTRILYHTDEHFTSRSPKSRRDNFGEAIIKKIQWLTNYGNKMGVDAFLLGGDLFNFPVQNAFELNRIYEAFIHRKAPSIGVIGNHPIKGNVKAWMPHSGVLLLERLGLVEWRDPWAANIEIDGVVFRLHHTDLMRHPILRGDGTPLWPHITWDQYDPEGANVVLISHYHPCQGEETINGVHFVSPGAVSRGTLAEDDLTREPAATLIEIKKGKSTFKRIIIPHDPSEDVFDERSTLKVDEVETNSEAIHQALKAMRSTRLDSTIGPVDLVRLIHSTTDVSNEALALAIEKLQEVGSVV